MCSQTASFTSSEISWASRRIPVSADSLGFGELQSFLAGYKSLQYLSASCIMAMVEDLTEICHTNSAVKKPKLKSIVRVLPWRCQSCGNLQQPRFPAWFSAVVFTDLSHTLAC